MEKYYYLLFVDDLLMFGPHANKQFNSKKEGIEYYDKINSPRKNKNDEIALFDKNNEKNHYIFELIENIKNKINDKRTESNLK